MALYDNDPLMGTDPYAQPVVDPFLEAMNPPIAPPQVDPIDLSPGEPSLIDPAAFPVVDPFLAAMERQEAQDQEAIPAPPEFDTEVLPEPAFEPVERTSFDGAPQQSTFAGDELEGRYGRLVDGAPEQPSFDAGQLEQPDSFADAFYWAADENNDQPLAMPEGLEERGDYYDQLSPEARIKQFAEEDAAKESYFAEQQGKLLEDDRRAADANEQRYQLAREESAKLSAELRQDIDALAAQKVDPGRWQASRTGLQTAAMYLTAAMGGFMAPRQGGRNRALEGIMKAIDQDINAQKFDLQSQRQGLRQRQSLIGELGKAGRDEHQATESARIVRLKQASQLLQVEASQYDPDGTAYRRSMEMQQQLEGEAAARAAALEERTYKRSMEIADQDISRAAEMRQQQQLNHNIEQDDYERKRKARRGPARPKVGSVAEQEHLIATGYLPYKDSRGLRIPAEGEAAAALRVAGPSVDTKDNADTAKAVAQAKIAEKQANAFSTYDPSRKGVVFKNSDGSVFEAPTPEEAKELRSRQVITQKMRTTVDRLKGMMEDGGGASEILGSKEYQTIVADVAKLDLQNAVALGLGAISSDDGKFLIDRRGGNDPTSFVKNAIPGLEHMVKGQEVDVNTEMTGMGYTGPDWKPVRENKVVARETPSTDLVSKAVNPVPVGLDLSADERAEYIKNAAEDITVAAGRRERRGPRAGVDYLSAVEGMSSDLSFDERLTVGVPLVVGNRSIGGRYKAIQKLIGVDDMTDLQRQAIAWDPDFTARVDELDKRLKEAGAFDGPGFKAMDTWKIVTGHAKGSQ